MDNVNEQMVYVEIFECAYKDNWKEGEIDNTFQTTFLEKDLFKSAKDAIEHFKDSYSGLAYGICKPQVVEPDFIAMDFMAKADDRYGWATPSDEDLEAWKAGKIDLWSVEFQMKMFKLQPIESKELEKLL